MNNLLAGGRQFLWLLVLLLTVLISAPLPASAANTERVVSDAEKLALPYYEYAKELANKPKYAELRVYSDHGINHARLTVAKALEAADAIEKAVKGNPNYGPIDRNELAVAAIFHDTGMDGGEFRDYENGNLLRKDHSLNAAIHVLENREGLSQLVVNLDAVALDCLLHSKSCSGVRDLTSEEQMTDCLDRLSKAVEEYNALYPEAPIFFDMSAWTNGERIEKPSEKDKKKKVSVYKMNKETMKRTASAAAALRLGDANREADAYPYTQSGEKIEVNFDSYIKDAKTWEDEVRKADITITDEKGQPTLLTHYGPDPDGYARMYSAGEGNLHMDCRYNSDTKRIQELFLVIHGPSFPLSTQACIEERLEELDTMPGVPAEVLIRFKGDFTKDEKKAIERSYSRYCNKAKKKHKIPVSFEFVK